MRLVYNMCLIALLVACSGQKKRNESHAAPGAVVSLPDETGPASPAGPQTAPTPGWSTDAEEGAGTGEAADESEDEAGAPEPTTNPWEDWYRRRGNSGGGYGSGGYGGYGSSGGDPAGEAESCVKGSELECAVEAELVRLVNQERQKAGLDEVKHNFEVSFVSRDWSKQQFTRGMSHAGFPRERQQVFRDEFDRSPPSMTAENVAQNRTRGTDAKALARSLMSMWMNSSGHRGNILGRHRALGAGVSIRGSSVMATQIFVR